MKLLVDFFPILLFFVAYKFAGIYIATAVAIAVSALQVGFYWCKHRSFDKMQLITLVLIVVLGGATLLFHNEVFIKWKPTAVNWVLAIVFFGSQFIGKQNLLQKMLGHQVQLPAALWRRLNLSWALFFLVMGLLNIYVAYHFDTDTWVNFKLFGLLGLSIVFVLLQGAYVAKYATEIVDKK